MAEKEIDVIEHLLDLEHEAASLLLDAQTEADKRTAEARSRADAAYKKEYAALIEKLETEYKEKSSEITSKHDVDYEAYKNRISASSKDIPSFNKLLDSLLFSTN